MAGGRDGESWNGPVWLVRHTAGGRARRLITFQAPVLSRLGTRLMLVLALLGGAALLLEPRAEGSGRVVRGAAGPTGVPEWWDTGGRMRIRSSRIILVYNSGGMPAWTSEQLKYYVSHLRTDGTRDGWFFDTFLVLALAAESQRGFDPGYGSGPSRAEDWRWYLDQRLFGAGADLAQLEAAVAEAGVELGDRRHLVRVIIGVPYPDPRGTDFGRLGDRPLDFSRSDDRASAVRWYLREVSQRWTASHFEHLRLGGFYWIREEAPEGDRELLRLVSNLVGSQLLPLYWIPYYGSAGYAQWRELGFDLAIQQPNYYFYDVPAERLREAARFAWNHRMGVELELDRRVLQSEERRSRYQRYLQAGAEHGYQHAGVLAWYDDCALMECARAQDPAVRRIYDDTYDFVRGVYPRN